MADLFDSFLFAFALFGGALIGMGPVALYHMGDMRFEAALLTQVGLGVLVLMLIHHQVAIDD